MPDRADPISVEPALARATLPGLAVAVAAVRAGWAMGVCVLVRLAGAVAGVPAWSADRAPPGVPFPARPSTPLR